MTTYYPINELPDVLYDRLQYIQSTYGVAPDDPPKAYGSFWGGWFTTSFGHLYYLTKDSRMHDLYVAHRDHVLSDLDSGYLTHHGTYSPTEADQQPVPYLIDLYNKLGDSNLFTLIDDVSAGFAGLRDSNNWPTTSDGGYTIPTNDFGGDFWGTVNMEATALSTLTYAYYTQGTKCYHNSSVEEMIWNIAKWIASKQLSDGSWPRDNGGSYEEVYDMATSAWYGLAYIILSNKGDIIYNSESVKDIIKSSLDSHWEFMQNKYGSRVVYYHGYDNFSQEMINACVEGYCREWLITGLLRTNIWNKYTGHFYQIDSNDERKHPIYGTGVGMFFDDSYNLSNSYERWS